MNRSPVETVRSPVVAGQQKAVTVFGTIGQFDVVEVGTAIGVPQLTTTERNALTAANGWIIYNTTDSKMQAYENGSWANLI
tara:strand:- start:1060 stop:1302 length:243 start_codon:yes stop_codon:yes gene_type:complete